MLLDQSLFHLQKSISMKKILLILAGKIQPLTISFAIIILLSACTQQSFSQEGTLFLQAQEICGGHTLERHVNKSDEYLKKRLRNSNISAASTFTGDVNKIGKVMLNALAKNKSRIAQWLSKKRRGRDRLVLDIKNSRRRIGKVLQRGFGKPKRTRSFKMVLIRKTCQDKKYVILTAYPTPR